MNYNIKCSKKDCRYYIGKTCMHCENYDMYEAK